MGVVVRFVTVLQKFPVNVLYAWWTQIFVAVPTVDLLEVFRFSEVLQKFPRPLAVMSLLESVYQAVLWLNYCQ
jgi:hypothetical protein